MCLKNSIRHWWEILGGKEVRIWICFIKSRIFLKWKLFSFFFGLCYSSSGARSSPLISLSSTFFLCCSVAQSCPTLCHSMDYSIPGFPVLHYLLEFAQTHVLWFLWASHPQSPPSPPARSLSQHQSFFQWVESLHQVAKVLDL